MSRGIVPADTREPEDGDGQEDATGGRSADGPGGETTDPESSVDAGVDAQAAAEQPAASGEEGALAAQVYVRPTALADPVDERLERLERLASEGVVDDLSVEAWPDEVPLSPGYADAGVVDVYRRFVSWAERADATVEPAFATRTSHSQFTDETRTVLSTPMLCLALYQDDRLRAVYPHADEEDHYTVGDGLRELTGDAAFEPEGPLGDAGDGDERLGDAGDGDERLGNAGDRGGALRDAGDREGPLGDAGDDGEPSRRLPESDAGPVPDVGDVLAGDCPVCGAAVANVQGVAACSDCSWLVAGTVFDGWSRPG